MRLQHRGCYPDDWNEIGDAVRAAAGNRCIRCGHPAGDRPSVRSQCDERCTHLRDDKLRILTVHHMDGDKANCRWWNLLSLCQGCHLQIQGKLIPERPYLWEHKEWAKPYVAGFYAWHHEGREVTRAEVEADLDRFLKIGQPWLYEVVPTVGAKGAR